VSTYWNVHCAKCKDAGPLFDGRFGSPSGVRNGDRLIRELMEHRQELIPLARALARCERIVPYLEASIIVCIGERVDIGFFAEHDCCPLVMRSDQGDEEALP
jgi:hypothetical protein